jgi:hypothetical protein
MITVPINPTQFTDAGFTFTHTSGALTAYFTVTSAAKPVPVGVSTDGTNLFFFPERSASQRVLLVTLGIAF